VPSIERALAQLKFRPVHEPLRHALGKGHLTYLVSGWDSEKGQPTKEATVALEERMVHVADGLAYMRGGADAVADAGDKAKRAADLAPVLETLRGRFSNILARAHAAASDRTAVHLRGAGGETTPSQTPASASADAANVAKGGTGEGGKVAPAIEREASAERVTSEAPNELRTEAPAGDATLLLAWAQTEAVIDLIARARPKAKTSRAAIIAEWELALPLVGAFGEHASSYDAEKRAALVLLGATLPSAPVREVMLASLSDARGRAWLGVHEAGGALWLAKEAFEELARFVADREAAEGRSSVAMAERQVADVVRVASKEGYRAENIARALAADVTLAPDAAPANAAPVNAASNKGGSDKDDKTATDKADRADEGRLKGSSS
jgi:hypothetical protein